jgi:hypothetical protein
MATAAMTGCSGGGSDTSTDKQLLLWERRVKGLKKMLLGFDQARKHSTAALSYMYVKCSHIYHRSILLSLLTPWNRGLLKRLIVAELSNKMLICL